MTEDDLLRTVLEMARRFGADLGRATRTSKSTTAGIAMGSPLCCSRHAQAIRCRHVPEPLTCSTSRPRPTCLRLPFGFGSPSTTMRIRWLVMVAHISPTPRRCS